jgi:hypothetical protein
MAQKGGEGGGDGALVIEIQIGEGLEFVVIGFDGLVGGFEIEAEHEKILAMFRG